jgi:hypothetical protein
MFRKDAVIFNFSLIFSNFISNFLKTKKVDTY